MGSDESIRVNNANYFETEESKEVPCITMEELNSSLSALKNKAPGQGAVLSPLLFNIMLSDLPVADGVQLIIYADDITILSKGDSLTEVRACLQRYLDSLAAWFKK
ncbi:Reverse transcriptase domain [Trinorchestia longiramus]|nr:Reverse transcriptase domain [Trinorchestia longiramus]